MTRNYAKELAAKGKRRVGWALPIELVERVEHEASMRIVSPAKLVEILLDRGIDDLPGRDELRSNRYG